MANALETHNLGVTHRVGIGIIKVALNSGATAADAVGLIELLIPLIPMAITIFQQLMAGCLNRTQPGVAPQAALTALGVGADGSVPPAVLDQHRDSARTALRIANRQHGRPMTLKQLRDVPNEQIDQIPIQSYANIMALPSQTVTAGFSQAVAGSQSLDVSV